MKRVFDIKKETQPPPSVRDTSDRITKRGESVEEKIKMLDAELARYKEQLKRTRPGPAQEAIKARAMRVLKQKRMYESQRDMLYNQTFNLDQDSFAADGIKDARQTMAATHLPEEFMATLQMTNAQRRFLQWGRKKTLQGPIVLNQAPLEAFNYWELIDELLGTSQWRYLLQFQDRASLSRTVEFLCTATYLTAGREVKDPMDITPSTMMSFYLGGMNFTFSILELGWRLGIYTIEESSSPEFSALPHRLPEDFDIDLFWQAHSTRDGPFVRKEALSVNWIRTEWRILTFILNSGIFGCPQNANRVSVKDIFFYWSLTERLDVNLAVFMARFFYTQAHTQRISLQAGPFITMLARSLNIPVPDDLLPLDQSVRQLVIPTLSRMSIPKRPRTDDVVKDAFDLDVLIQDNNPPYTSQSTSYAYCSEFHSTQKGGSSSQPPPSMQDLMTGITRLSTRMETLFAGIERQHQETARQQREAWEAWRTKQEEEFARLRSDLDDEREMREIKMQEMQDSIDGQTIVLAELREALYQTFPQARPQRRTD